MFDCGLKGQVQWAIAGRSEEKLLKLKEQLVKIDETCKDVPVLTADLGDPKSLDRLVKQSDVLISTAGPFWSIGYPLVCSPLHGWLIMTAESGHAASMC